ncbi:uncharacterized protein K02A2.6-like [Mizuhopecten yessoensis]|uniref:uncharacterized protein K02A2.6-like n=1 Tax=Mizuhopecten yessoensis TaxID=6573 RepID=UPI000B45C1CB|nr:uncharacterized protein K02A2.6-like [Mizuhopecten yessoensis]
MSVMDGIIFKGPKIVVPKCLRLSMLETLHTGHLGIEKCRRRARDMMLWPQMNKDISDFVLNCNVGFELRNSNPKEPLLPRNIPDRPWQTIATSLFSWNGEDFVVIVDYFSRYFEVSKLPSTTSNSVIAKLKDAFSRHDIPEKVISDNGPQYASEKFTEFALLKLGISSTKHPARISHNHKG